MIEKVLSRLIGPFLLLSAHLSRTTFSLVKSMLKMLYDSLFMNVELAPCGEGGRQRWWIETVYGRRLDRLGQTDRNGWTFFCCFFFSKVTFVDYFVRLFVHPY